MIVKKTITSKDFGAISKQAQFLFSKLAERINPKFGQGVISTDSAKFLNFSKWMTSTGLSDDLKQYQLPLPAGVQESYPDYNGLQATKQNNKIFDEALASVVREMRNEELDQVSFATEGEPLHRAVDTGDTHTHSESPSGTPTPIEETDEYTAFKFNVGTKEGRKDVVDFLGKRIPQMSDEGIRGIRESVEKYKNDKNTSDDTKRFLGDVANRLDSAENDALGLTKRMFPKKNESLSDMWNRWDNSQKIGVAAGVGATALGLGHWLTKKKKDALDHAVGIASLAAPVLGATAGSLASDKYAPGTYDKSYITEQLNDYIATLNDKK